MKKMMNERSALIMILLASLLLMGQEGCQQAGIGAGKVSTQAASYGLDFSLIPGVEMLSEGSKISLGDTFRIGMHIENYDKSAKSGELCIKDDIEDVYGGVKDSCVLFNVREAEYDNGKIVKSGQKDVYFPSKGEYSYHDFPITQQVNLFVTAKYTQHSVVQGSVRVPEPMTEAVSLTQLPEVISVSVEKTVSSREDGYKANMAVTFTKKLSNAEIFTPDFKRKGLIFNPQLSNYMVDCGLQQNTVDIENTRLIKCFAFLPKEQLTYPLLLNMDYGVSLKKEFTFMIQKGVAA